MSVPSDVAAALCARGLVPTGRIGTSGGWLARGEDGGLTELVVLAGHDEPAPAAPHHEHLVPVLESVDLGGGRRGLLVGHVAGMTLAAVCRARVPLTDAEVATLAIPLAQALDALHAAGLARGPFDAERVILTGEGKPVLAGPFAAGAAQGDDLPRLLTLLLAAMPPPMDLPAEWDDDPGLRSVLEGLLRDGCPCGSRLVEACLDAVDPEPIRLPDAGAMARAHVLDPVGGRHDEPLAAGPRGAGRLPRRPGRGVWWATSGQVAPPGRRPAPVRTRRELRRRSRRRSVLGPTGLAAVALVLVLAVLLRPAVPVRAEEGPAPTAASSAAAAGRTLAADPSVDAGDRPEVPADPIRDRADPAGAAAALTRLRADVIASGDPGRLAEVDAPGGEAHAADAALMATLAGDRLEGLSADVQAVSGAFTVDDRTRSMGFADVTFATSPYTRVAGDGTVTTEPGTAPRTVRLQLAWTPDGWRVQSVSDRSTAP